MFAQAEWYVFWLIGFSVLSIVFLLLGFRTFKRKRLIDDLPTSKAHGVFIGLVELKGTAESEQPLMSHLAGVSCVYYTWSVDEQWSRTVTETHTDSKGHTQTRTRTETGWTTVASGTESPCFYLKDDTGIVRIDPQGADIRGIQSFNETCRRNDPLYYEKGPSGSIPNTTHRRRFTETVLPLHTNLYIIGQSRERQDAVAAEVAKDKAAPMFLISTKDEQHHSKTYGRWTWFWLILSFICAALAALYWGAIAYAIILALGWLWTVYNSLVDLRNRVVQGISQVDVQLKRRHDLVPRLVEAIKGYAAHEKMVQEAVTEIRARSESDARENNISMAPLVMAIAERYPELKAGGSFLSLQSSLVDTEQRIALARDYSNEIITYYNTRLEVIPDRFVARLACLKPEELLHARDIERAPVEVRLTD